MASNKEQDTKLRSLLMCSGKFVSHNILDRKEGYEYIEDHKLSVTFLKELKDGTPRRLWQLRDPEKVQCGLLYTALGDEGEKNKNSYLRDIFDFMEVKVDRRDWINLETSNTPRTPYFINKENEENEKE